MLIGASTLVSPKRGATAEGDGIRSASASSRDFIVHPPGYRRSVPALMHVVVNLRFPLKIFDSCATRCARRQMRQKFFRQTTPLCKPLARSGSWPQRYGIASFVRSAHRKSPWLSEDALQNSDRRRAIKRRIHFQPCWRKSASQPAAVNAEVPMRSPRDSTPGGVVVNSSHAYSGKSSAFSETVLTIACNSFSS